MSVRFSGRCEVRVNFPGVQKLWFNLKVYDTAAELQRLAAQWHSQPLSEWADTVGCFHGHDGPGRYIGLMRLCDEHMNARVVIHEAVHAAVAFARVHFGGALDLGSDVTDREELLAYATDDIAESILQSAAFTASPNITPA